MSGWEIALARDQPKTMDQGSSTKLLERLLRTREIIFIDFSGISAIFQKQLKTRLSNR